MALSDRTLADYIDCTQFGLLKRTGQFRFVTCVYFTEFILKKTKRVIMTLYHFGNCLALAYLPFWIVYKYCGL